jgi:hypothetical protein
MTATPQPTTTLDYVTPTAARPSRAALWTGRVISALPVLMCLMGAFMALTRQPQAVEGMRQMGFSDRAGMLFGITLLACTLLYVIPPTSVLGAILLVGYLGGATFVHVHAGPTGQMWTPVVFGVLVWLGLLLREPRLRALLPLRR